MCIVSTKIEKFTLKYDSPKDYCKKNVYNFIDIMKKEE